MGQGGEAKQKLAHQVYSLSLNHMLEVRRGVIEHDEIPILRSFAELRGSRERRRKFRRADFPINENVVSPSFCSLCLADLAIFHRLDSKQEQIGVKSGHMRVLLPRGG